MSETYGAQHVIDWEYPKTLLGYGNQTLLLDAAVSYVFHLDLNCLIPFKSGRDYFAYSIPAYWISRSRHPEYVAIVSPYCISSLIGLTPTFRAQAYPINGV